ncbi:MAG: zf-HC2 domain-containing protein [Saprospiraceae bacterium]|nr:zf-HC2 domain-containing protein [Pyrinomonadaceae bacterium]
MTSQISPIQDSCPSGEISAYIDGELSPVEEIEVESHFGVCIICSTELNRQKSFLSALSSSLEREKEFELPKNFTKTIVANAESRVSGLRRPRERFNAVFICTALFLFILFALGSDAETLFGIFVVVLEKAAAVGAFAFRLVYSVSLGAVVVARSLSSQILFSSYLSFLFFAGLFGFLLFACSRLILRSDRS